MELTPFEIYLMFTADSVRGVVGALAIFALACIVGVVFAFMVTGGDTPVVKPLAVLAPIAVIVGLLWAAMPSTKILVAMYGIPAAIEGTKAAASSELGQKTYRAVSKLLDEYLEPKK